MRACEHEAECCEEPPDPGEELDVDSSIETTLANETMTKCEPTNLNSLVPKEACLKLPPTARLVWNKLDPQSKAMILSAHEHKANKLPPKPPYKDNTSSHEFTLADLHQLLDTQDNYNDVEITHEDDDEESTRLANFSQAKELTTGDVRKILSVPNEKGHDIIKRKAQVNKTEVHKPDAVIDGTTYRAANIHVTYSLSITNRIHKNSLIDRCANGGVTGDDVRIISCHPNKKVDVIGVDNHLVSAMPVATAIGVMNSTVGPIIVILHQHANMGKGNSMHSSIQMEYFKATVDDESIKAGDKQHIITNDDCMLPSSIKNGLPYVTTNRNECHDFDIDCFFRCQLLEDEPKLHDIQH